MTLTELSEGAHNITLLVRTTDNNMSPGYAKETVFFNVDLDNMPTTLPPVPSPSISEYSLIILPIIMVAAIFLIVVLRKKNCLEGKPGCYKPRLMRHNITVRFAVH
jgi:hypothetical protein